MTAPPPPATGSQQPESGTPGYEPPPGYGPPLAPAGYSAAPPAVAKRIPEDQPFVVRPNTVKRVLHVCAVAAPLSAIASVAGAVLLSEVTSHSVAILGSLSLFICVLALVVAGLGFPLWLIASGGPLLAVGPTGIWIKSRPARGQAIWLPWEGIAHISRRRWSLEKMVVVKPRDPRADSNLGAFTAVDAGLLKLFYGSGFTATLNFADKPEAEIMAAITHFSAGRCPITW